MRKTRLGVDQMRAIDQFAELLFIMFPHQWGVVHCGSSLTRDDWRDVDLRIILDDSVVDQIEGVLNVLDLNMLLSRWGRQVTGLPIDCQVQRRSVNAKEAVGENGERRQNWRGAGQLGIMARSLRESVENPDGK